MMGYFPNSDAGMAYEAAYCARCVHGGDDSCAVMEAHLLHNYDRGIPAVAGILDILIPRDGVENEQRAMFREEQPHDGPAA